eukprot:SAG11_NODE_241_length_11781_cov_8.401900_9_plen_152_part_00
MHHASSHRRPQTTTAGELFASMDSDGSGTLCASEMRDTLASFGVPLTMSAVRAVMLALDLDGNGVIDVAELASMVDKYRRNRRAFAASVLDSVLRAVNQKKISILTAFRNADHGRSGALNHAEFSAAMAQVRAVIGSRTCVAQRAARSRHG